MTSLSGIPGGHAGRSGPTREAPDRLPRGTSAQHRPARRRPAQHRPRRGTSARARAARADTAAETALFTRWVQDYAADRSGQQITVLLAGAVTAASDLGLAELREGGADISVGLVDTTSR